MRHFLIVKGLMRMLWGMAKLLRKIEGARSERVISRRAPVSRSKFAEIAAQALDALQEPEGQDLGPLSHEERIKILFGS